MAHAEMSLTNLLQFPLAPPIDVRAEQKKLEDLPTSREFLRSIQITDGNQISASHRGIFSFWYQSNPFLITRVRKSETGMLGTKSLLVADTEILFCGVIFLGIYNQSVRVNLFQSLRQVDMFATELMKICDGVLVSSKMLSEKSDDHEQLDHILQQVLLRVACIRRCLDFAQLVDDSQVNSEPSSRRNLMLP